MQTRLQFGDIDAKRRAEDFAQRSALRQKQVKMVVDYFVRFVDKEFWPGEDMPRSTWPKALRHLPAGILAEGARILIEMKPA